MRLLWASLLLNCAFAQNPVSDAVRTNYATHKRNILEAVDKVPEGYYAFRPTAEVRTFAEQVVHIAASNFSDCSQLKGEANPNPSSNQPSSKADVVALLKSSYAYCDPVIDSLQDAQLADKVKRGDREFAKAVAGVHILWHPSLHYGNLITYMRLKGIVPPETERAQTKPAEPPKLEMVTYYLVFLKKGDRWSPQSTPESEKIQEGHMAHMSKMHSEGKLVLAGPFGDGGDLRGIQLYKAANLEEAKSFAALDPAVQAGRLAVEIHPWLTQKGSLP